ncbi:MAG: M23 family metallopeptidase [Steroidobacteraceae bacterium]
MRVTASNSVSLALREIAGSLIFRLVTMLAFSCLLTVPAAGQLAAIPGFPLQLEMRVLHEPTAFPSAGRMHVYYELYLTNFSSAPLDVHSIEVLDAKTDQPVAAFEGRSLAVRWQPVGPDAKARELPTGGTAIVFISVHFQPDSAIPQRLLHRVITGDRTVEGAAINVHGTRLVVGPPVAGSDWLASDAPGIGSHHWHLILIVNGRPQISARFAIDWKQVHGGVSYAGNKRDVHSYFSYGKPVLAVADGVLVHTRDGLPDNVPGHLANYHPAVPITLHTITGNTIVLALGHGLFAHYMHLKAGSLRVKPGDHVHRGQILAQIGCSGDAREPHLHFQISTSPDFWAGEGVPYLIDHYRIVSGSDVTGERARELPLDNFVVDFGRAD